MSLHIIVEYMRLIPQKPEQTLSTASGQAPTGRNDVRVRGSSGAHCIYRELLGYLDCGLDCLIYGSRGQVDRQLTGSTFVQHLQHFAPRTEVKRLIFLIITYVCNGSS